MAKKTLLLFAPDLFFSTKIEDAAGRLGLQVVAVDSQSDLNSLMAASNPVFALVSFDRTGGQWERVASAILTAGVKVVAFGSHMNVDAFKRAKDLGCEQVLSNSRLSAELPKLLAEWAGS